MMMTMMLSFLAVSVLGLVALPSAQAFYYYDCYTDTPDGTPALDGPFFFDYPAMTYEKCGSFCITTHNRTLLGLRNGGECYCGNALAAGVTVAVDPAECNMVCRGNTRSICGSEHRMNLLGVPQNPPPTTPTSP